MRSGAMRDDRRPRSRGFIVGKRTQVHGRRLQSARAALAVLAFTLLLTLSACGLSGAGAAGTPTVADEGTLAGQVLAGPTCPVERAESPCPPRPVGGRRVDVQTSAGQVVATATTDALGKFNVALAPGSYVVRVESAPASIFPRQTAPVNVTIHAGEITNVQILLDTGIR